MTTSSQAVWDSPSRPQSLRPLLLAILAVWLFTVIVLGAAGVFVSSPTQPPLAIAIAVAAPPLLFALAYNGSARFRDLALSLDLRWLTAIQAWRVIGGSFLFLYAFGVLPGLFAWPAGVGDALVGFSAPFVAMAVVRQSANWQRRVLWLNVAGLTDFVFAVGTGVLASNSAIALLPNAADYASMGALPLSIVPTFGVPLWTIFHIISLLQLRRAAAR